MDEKRPRLRRRLAVALLVVLATVVLAPVAAWLWLESPSGSAFLRGRVLAALDGAMRGRVELDSVSISGLIRVEIRGARLFAPDEAEPVAALDHAIVDVRAAALLARRIELSEVTLEGPRLRLVTGPAGSNLDRALEPVHAAPPREEKRPEKQPEVYVRAPSIAVRGARATANGTEVDVGPADLDASVAGTPEDIDARLALRIVARAPVEREATLAAVLGWHRGQIRVERLSVKSGGSRIALSGTARAEGIAASLDVEEFVAGVEDLRQYITGIAFRGDVRLSGTASLHDGRVATKLRTELPAGHVDVEAAAGVNLKEASLLDWSASASARGVEVAQVAEGLPPALVRLDLEAEGEGIPGQGTASVKLDASGSRFRGLALERLSLRARTKGRSADVEGLAARAAGVGLELHGTASADRGQVEAFVESRDLASSAAQLRRGLGIALPAMEGEVRVRASVSGPWKNPQLDATVEAPALAVEGNRVRGARVGAALRRVSPLEGTLSLDAASGFAGGYEARDLALRAAVDGRTVAADLKGLLGGRPVGLKLRGQRDKPPRRGAERWDFSALELHALGVAMRARGTSTVEAYRGQVSVHGLAMDGDLGHVELSGSGSTEGPVQADLSVAGLEVEKLPAGLLPQGTDAAGTVALDAHVGGTAKAPRVEARLRVRAGRWKMLGPVALDADARFDERRVAAAVRADLPGGGKVVLDAAGSVDAAQKRDETLHASLTLEGVDVALAASVAPDLPKVAGRLAGRLSFDGPLAAPAVEADLKLEGGAVAGLDKLQAALGLRVADGKAHAAVVARRPGTLGADVQVDAPFDLAAYLGDFKLDPDAIPFDATVRVDQADLAWLARLGYAPAGMAGSVSGRATAGGTRSSPHGDAVVVLRGLAAAGRSGLDAKIEVSAQEKVSAKLEADLDGRRALDLSIAIPRSVGALMKAEPGSIPLALDAKLHPVPLARLLPADAPPPVQSDVSAELHLSGTPDAPSIRMSAALEELDLQGKKVGRFDAQAQYADSVATAKATFRSKLSGELLATARLEGPLGLSVLRAGGSEALLDRVADLRLETTDFDLALADGFASGVKDLGGRLDVHLARRGRLREPVAEGTVKLRDGHAYLLEVGGFSQVGMDLAFSDEGGQAVTLNRLAGRSGTGRFEARGRVVPAGSGIDGERRWSKMQGALDLSVTELPIVQSYQTRAYLTMKLHGSGSQTTWTQPGGVARTDVVVPEVRMAEGLLRIPDRLQKSVQSLEPNPDIVIAGREKPAAQGSQKPSRRTVRATVIVPDDFRLEAPLGTKLTAGARVDLEYDPARASSSAAGGALRVNGTARLIEGKLNLVARTFDVDSGRIEFRGPMDNPALDVKAHYTGPDQTVVDVAIGGTAKEPVTRFTSNRIPDETEILYYLATNQRQTRAKSEAPPGLGDWAYGKGVSLLGSAVAGVAKGLLAKVLPREPELQLETDASKMTFKTRGGLYVSEGVYVGVQYNSGANGGGANPQQRENAVEGELKVRIGESATGRVHAGDAGQWGGEFLWQKDIPTAAQRRASEKK